LTLTTTEKKCPFHVWHNKLIQFMLEQMIVGASVATTFVHTRSSFTHYFELLIIDTQRGLFNEISLHFSFFHQQHTNDNRASVAPLG
jgi:hypothetical protein